MKDIENVLTNSTYKGLTYHKGRTTHVFQIKLMGEDNYILANEDEVFGISLYSITDSSKVLIKKEKEKSE